MTNYIKEISSYYEAGLKKVRSVISKKINMSLNWPYILIFVFLWSYAYQGAIGLKSSVFQLGFSAYLAGVSIYLLFLGIQKKEFSTLKFTFLIKDILILFLMVVFWTIVSFDKLNQPIVGDHFYHGLGAIKHELFSLLILSKFINIENIIFKDAIYFLDILIIIFFVLIIFISRHIKFNLISASILTCAVLLVLRYIALTFGGGMNPHPPLQLFPIWLSTSIFGLSDLSFRFAQFIGLIACSYMIYMVSIRRLGRVNSIFAATALCSIPLFIHVSTLVEASIWTSILWVFILIQIPSMYGRSSIYWFSLTSVISIFVLLRITSFIAYPLILILFMKYNWPLFLKNKKDFVRLMSPFLICLPFLSVSIIFGTPGSIGSETELISKDYLVFNHIIYVLKSGSFIEIVLSNMNAAWLLLLLGIFIKLENEKNYFFNRIIIILFFILVIEMFFSIGPGLWGTDRYQAEYLVPFIILGGYLLFSKINTIWKQNFLIPLFSFFLIYSGVIGFHNYSTKPNMIGQGNISIRQTEQIYDYKTALIAAKNAGLAGKTLLVGVTYGALPQILSGFTIKEVKESIELNKKLMFGGWSSASAELINNEPEIKLVLMTEMSYASNQDNLRKNLLLLGWKDWNIFSPIGANVVIGVIRDN